MPEQALELIFDPPSTLTEEIFGHLEAFNQAQFPNKDFESNLAAVLRNAHGMLVGGAYGRLSWGYLYIDSLWLAQTERGTGKGKQLLKTMEQAALAKGYTRAHLWTTSFQALDFYRSNGYELFGQLPHRPPGHITYFLHKQALL